MLSRGEEQMRETRGYAEQSRNLNEHCGNCAFFRSGEHANCGECDILGGTVNQQGYCDSWADK